MEGKEDVTSGVTLKGDEAPENFRVTPPVSEGPGQVDGPAMVTAPPASTVTPVSAATPSTDGRKKRGRPRKYGPDGVALSPMPISASIPLTGEYSAWQRGRGRPIDSVKKKHKFEFESPGEKIAYFVGANFTPHVLTVNPGEGRFEILSLSGSYMPIESGGTMSRSGGMSVSLAGPDGRVVGGGLAGLLVAAGPVQVVVGSFLPGHQLEQKPKKQRVELPPTLTPTITNLNSREELVGSYGGGEPIVTTTAIFNGENSVPVQDSRNPTTENRVSFTVEESNGLS
ncbi:hypothetical protein BT93_A2315 [Corymbia citriodora subsp. variegata]|nr:hypothetical protein BT93_A2315 [Corymbia citriodora subsp. variegata]